MPRRIIDEMPTRGQVERASDYEIVCWQFYLRPTMSNTELEVVKLIATKYEQLPDGIRGGLRRRSLQEYES